MVIKRSAYCEKNPDADPTYSLNLSAGLKEYLDLEYIGSGYKILDKTEPGSKLFKNLGWTRTFKDQIRISALRNPVPDPTNTSAIGRVRNPDCQVTRYEGIRPGPTASQTD